MRDALLSEWSRIMDIQGDFFYSNHFKTYSIHMISGKVFIKMNIDQKKTFNPQFSEMLSYAFF